jgi:ABC-type nitrate/sulfonate/bicarbonate transport system permease component
MNSPALTRDPAPAGQQEEIHEITADTEQLKGPGRFDRFMRTPLGAILPVAAVIILWEVGGRLGLIDEVFFPVPTRIVDSLLELSGEGIVTEQLWVTVQRVALGFAIGTIPAVVLGLLMGRVRWIEAIFDPLITVTYPIPHLATLPLLLVIFGLGSPPIIALAAIVCFYPAVVSSLAGVRQIDERLVLMARNMGASKRTVLLKIVLPGALPAVFAGLRLALGLALLGTVAGEFVASDTGIGAQTWQYWQVYQITNMYATLLVTVALGFVLITGAQWVERRFFGWSLGVRNE